MKKFYKTNWLSCFKLSAMLAAILFAGSAMAQLSGTYTINAAAPTSGTNFNSFTAFANALTSVSGPVTVNVVSSANPYTEQLRLNAISGVSAINTVTINGNGQTLRSTSSQAVVDFNGADYVTISNLIISAQGTGNGTRGVWFHNASDYNEIVGCQIIFTAYTGTSNSTGYIVFSNSATGNSAALHGSNNIIANNVMRGASNSYGPYYGISDFRSSSLMNTTGANEFVNNEIRDFFYYATYFWYTNGMKVENNDFHTSRSGATISWGIYAYYCKTTTHQIKIKV